MFHVSIWGLGLLFGGLRPQKHPVVTGLIRRDISAA